jgi:hypothetical protein
MELIHVIAIQGNTNLSTLSHLLLELLTEQLDDGAVGAEKCVADNPRLGRRIALGVFGAVGSATWGVDTDAVAEDGCTESRKSYQLDNWKKR